MADAPIRRAPSKTRSRSVSRALLKRSAELGKPSALAHGINSFIYNQPDFADELALIFASHPHLDRVQDYRLVELCAIAHVQHRRAVQALEEQGMTTTLVRYESDLGKRLERHLQAIHERDRERRREAQQRQTLDLTQYKRVGPEVGE